MKMKRLRDWIKVASPSGWKPSVGSRVIVPSRTGGKAWSAEVEAVFDDIVRVRVPRLRDGRQEVLMRDVRPHPFRKSDC